MDRKPELKRVSSWQNLLKQILDKERQRYKCKCPGMLGEKNHQWKGGRLKREGYILVNKRDHPFADKRGYVKEHRLVWEQHHKACLLPWAHCHHLNSVKDDNRIENLQAMMHREHTRLECLKLKPWRFNKRRSKK